MHKGTYACAAARSQGTRLKWRDSRSNIRAITQAGQKGEQQFNMNHCREPNFQVFGVARPPKKDNLNCVEAIAVEESSLPAAQDNVKNRITSLPSLPHWICVTWKDNLYHFWCYHSAHPYSSSLEWVPQNVKKCTKKKEKYHSTTWSILHIFHHQENRF